MYLFLIVQLPHQCLRNKGKKTGRVCVHDCVHASLLACSRMNSVPLYNNHHFTRYLIRSNNFFLISSFPFSSTQHVLLFTVN